MTPPSSDFPLSAATASQQELQRGRMLATQSGVCAIVAVVLGLLWAPMMGIVAVLLRPPQLNSNEYPALQVASFQHDAELQLWVVLIASFLLILALMTLAIYLGRRALRFAERERVAARLGKRGSIILVISLPGVVVIALVEALLAKFSPAITFSYIYSIIQFIVIGLIAITALCAMGSFILNGIAVRKTAWARVRLVVSALLVLLWFIFVAFSAQFIVAFHMHLVF